MQFYLLLVWGWLTCFVAAITLLPIGFGWWHPLQAYPYTQEAPQGDNAVPSASTSTPGSVLTAEAATAAVRLLASGAATSLRGVHRACTHDQCGMSGTTVQLAANARFHFSSQDTLGMVTIMGTLTLLFSLSMFVVMHTYLILHGQTTLEMGLLEYVVPVRAHTRPHARKHGTLAACAHPPVVSIVVCSCLLCMRAEADRLIMAGAPIGLRSWGVTRSNGFCPRSRVT